jgi:hypothetical protein
MAGRGAWASGLRNRNSFTVEPLAELSSAIRQETGLFLGRNGLKLSAVSFQ